MAAEIKIIQGREEVIEEYRYKGHLYRIKITPRKGYPYYLEDTDGDGSLETRHTFLGDDLMIPQWVLGRW